MGHTLGPEGPPSASVRAPQRPVNPAEQLGPVGVTAQHLHDRLGRVLPREDPPPTSVWIGAQRRAGPPGCPFPPAVSVLGSDSLVGLLTGVSSRAARRGSFPRTFAVPADTRELPTCHADAACARTRLLVCCTAGCCAQPAVVCLARCRLLPPVDDPTR